MSYKRPAICLTQSFLMPLMDGCFSDFRLHLHLHLLPFRNQDHYQNLPIVKSIRYTDTFPDAHITYFSLEIHGSGSIAFAHDG